VAVTELLTGIRILFAVLLAGAGLAKLAGLARFELVLVQLFGTAVFTRSRVSSRTVAVLVAAFELALAGMVGGGLLEPVSTALLVATMAVFGGVVWRAWRLHVDCGCFRDRRPTEVASLVRSAILLALAAVLAVGGLPPVTGTRQLALGGLWAAGLAVATYATVAGVRRLVRRSHPGSPEPLMVPEEVAAGILADAGRPGVPAGLPRHHGWVEVVALCQAVGLPVSTLLAELERRARPPATPLLPAGARVGDLVATSTRGERVSLDRLAPPVLVALFSATCTRCPGHVPELVDHLRARGPGRDRTVVVVAGEPAGAGLFVGAFEELATVVVEPMDGPVVTAFAVREFPAFHLLDGTGTVLAAGRRVSDLAPAGV
jgi:hypothetical protein